ncbi:HAD-superfamily hydrolase [mine drainage metagenome]|uniref:HAD-superfamily hydrolase n=1 Tax=mine drainage metagenome TaxID=410659 RepID=T1AJV6_9ZZZZ
MVKDIIFDLGGVLLDYTEEQYYGFLSKKYGLSKHKISKALNPMIERLEVGEMTIKQMRKQASKDFSIPNADLEWVRFFKSSAKPDMYMVSLAQRLKKRYRVSILSNVSRSRYIVARGLLIKRLGAYRIFTSCYMRMRKPNKQIYLAVLRALRAKPSETIFIDNLKANVVGAKRVGIKGIQFRNHSQITNALKRIGVDTRG